MKVKRLYCFFAAVLALGILISTGCRQVKPSFKETMVRENTVTVSLALVGDIMVHTDLLASAYNRQSGDYSFRESFAEVKPYLSSADLTIGNLETTLGGRELGFTGYPKFNSPPEILAALREAGFDILTTANNHAMDTGWDGVLNTLKCLDAEGIKHTGTFSSAAERAKILLEDINGIKTAVLAYTYGTNGLPVPKGKEDLVNLFDREQVREDIARAKEEEADIVLVSLHFGVEYRRIPGEEEIKLADELFRFGADIVIGSHPHVLQPMVRKDRLEGSEGLFTAYSMGNFISGQKGQYRDSGVILNLKLEKDLALGKIRLAEAGYIPVWVHHYREKGRIKVRVVAVEKAIRDYQQGLDQTLTAQDYARLQQVWQEITGLLSEPAAPGILHV